MFYTQSQVYLTELEPKRFCQIMSENTVKTGRFYFRPVIIKTKWEKEITVSHALKGNKSGITELNENGRKLLISFKGN